MTKDTVNSLTFPTSRWKSGVYTIMTELSTRQLGLVAFNSTVVEIPEILARVIFDRSEYKVRQNMSAELRLFNNYPVGWESIVNISIPVVDFLHSQYVRIESHKIISIELNIYLPPNLSAGFHEVITTLEKESATISSTFFVAWSDLEVSIDKYAYSRGENIILSIENVGGTDADYVYNLTLGDVYNPLAKKDGSSTLKAGEKSSLALLQG